MVNGQRNVENSETAWLIKRKKVKSGLEPCTKPKLDGIKSEVQNMKL